MLGLRRLGKELSYLQTSKRGFLPVTSLGKEARKFVEDRAKLLGPQDIKVCDGSEEEFQSIMQSLQKSGTVEPLNSKNWPNCWYAKSDPDDVARVEKQTYICSADQTNAGPTNNWMHPSKMHEILDPLFRGAMKGRTMYVLPFSMGDPNSPFAKTAIQVTDSSFVAANMKIMTRMGKKILDKVGDSKDFVPCTHTVGKPLQPGEKDVPWPCNKTKYIVHFPEKREIWSFGSGYGGNSLLGKKCLALRIASVQARDEGWLAEHMLILSLTNPKGEKKYIAAAFPSACGKTNLAMLRPTLPGWKVETVGDDIAWMRFGKDGRLYAVNPENGFFGVAPGTSYNSNPNAMDAMKKNTIFTNVALTPDKGVWWEGMDVPAPDGLIDWKGNKWNKSSGQPAAHPNSRFTTPLAQCPSLDSGFYEKEGVPISAILFGGRRMSTVPLVMEAKSWEHGVLYGAMVSSEQTAAAEGKVGELRHDPFAMLPFCGYNMGDYWGHWLNMQDKAPKGKDKLPKIYLVNWFRKGADGSFLWPGYGENSRVLAWVHARSGGAAGGTQTPIGITPKLEELNTEGLNINKENLKTLTTVDPKLYKEELKKMKQYFNTFDRAPKKLHSLLDEISSQF